MDSPSGPAGTCWGPGWREPTPGAELAEATTSSSVTEKEEVNGRTSGGTPQAPAAGPEPSRGSSSVAGAEPPQAMPGGAGAVTREQSTPRPAGCMAAGPNGAASDLATSAASSMDGQDCVRRSPGETPSLGFTPQPVEAATTGTKLSLPIPKFFVCLFVFLKFMNTFH